MDRINRIENQFDGFFVQFILYILSIPLIYFSSPLRHFRPSGSILDKKIMI